MELLCGCNRAIAVIYIPRLSVVELRCLCVCVWVGVVWVCVACRDEEREPIRKARCPFSPHMNKNRCRVGQLHAQGKL